MRILALVLLCFSLLACAHDSQDSIDAQKDWYDPRRALPD